MAGLSSSPRMNSDVSVGVPPMPPSAASASLVGHGQGSDRIHRVGDGLPRRGR